MITSVETKRYMSTEEASKYLGVSKAFLDKARSTGLVGIPFLRVGRLVKYDRHAIDSWIQGQASICAPAK